VRFVAIISVCSAIACAPARPLEHAQPTAESLARAVLDAIARRDHDTLSALALSEAEFREHVWPELPAARPERNMPMSYVWADLHRQSERGLRMILAEHGGRHYRLTALRFTGEITDYVAYRVHRAPVFVVSRGAAQAEMRLSGSLIEQAGRWKVFSYVTDD
jgi:hypothetical protein